MNALLKTAVNSLAGLFLSAALLSGAAQAQVPDRVGRISYLAGDVQFYSESEQAWLPAQLNAPVSSRNSLFTGADGRAEIRFGSTAVALDRQTQLDINVLDDNSFKAGVPRGSVSLRVPRIEGDESYEVMAPGASYTVLQAGRFRVDAADNGSSVAVLAGLVDASVAGDGSAMVEAGQALSVADGGFARSSAHSSALDNWAAQRDKAYRSSQSTRYVSPNMTGYEELDANGRWVSDPDYGNVWYPTTYVSTGWVPYRDGRWAYVPPWGWTWIDAAPWGFAPFHYGRWVLIGARWGWMPGAYVRRPSYAPALVGFIGGSTAGGVAISISIGTQPAVGWYPLPPWERYRPAYGHHDRQLRNINNFTISKPPSNAWRTVEHKRVSANQVQGATVVPREAFVDSRPVRRAAMPVSAPVLVSPHLSTAPVAAPLRSGVSAQPAPVRADPRPGVSRDENRQERRSVPVINPEPRSGEIRGPERRSQPAIVAPQTSQPVPVPRFDRPLEQAAPARREAAPRNGAPAVEPVIQQPRPQPAAPEVAAPPRMRAEPPAVRQEPRIVEPRVEQRIERRQEQRPEQRQMQRVEPPQARVPAAQPQAQPEPRRAPESDRERRPQGERDRDR